MKELLNRVVMQLTLRKNRYTLTVAIKKSYVKDFDHFYFSMFQRYTGNAKILKPTSKKEKKGYFLFQLDIPFEKYREFFTMGETIDLSIIRKKGEDEQRTRLKSNYDYLELQRIQVDEHHIFYPTTTREGNLSFHYRANYLYAKVDKFELHNNGTVSFEGLFHYDDTIDATLQSLQIVVTSNLYEEPIFLPVERQRLSRRFRKDKRLKRLGENGFRTQFHLKKYASAGKEQYFKFHLRATATIDGDNVTLESPRLKINHVNQSFPISRKKRFYGRNFKIVCKPTKKSKYLSVKVYRYRFLKEKINGLRKRWVEIRRSKALLKGYKFAFAILGKVLPVKKKLVMFESFHGKQFSDNPRAIYEYMKEHHMDYELVWSADRRHVDEFRKKNLLHVRRFSISWLFLMTRAKYWVTNARLPLWIPKPKHTTYLQTWHGTPLKRLAADMEEVHMPGTNTKKYKKNFITEASKWDYLISPNAYSTKIFQRAFQFKKEVIESGYPRNDYLYSHNNKEAIHQLKEKLGINQEKKVILYAPTWRDNQFYRKGKYKFDLELDLEKLQQKFGDTHIILLRMHYLVAENLDIGAYEGFVYDFSNYEDIRDLYLVADVLITDYSSVFFDYANLRRPMLFFVYDIDDYRDHLRGFYFDFEKKAPGPLVRTTDELIMELEMIEKHGFTPTENIEAFYKRFCYLEDGHASERVVKRLFS